MVNVPDIELKLAATGRYSAESVILEAYGYVAATVDRTVSPAATDTAFGATIVGAPGSSHQHHRQKPTAQTPCP